MTDLISDGAESCEKCGGAGKIYDSTKTYPQPCPDCKPAHMDHQEPLKRAYASWPPLVPHDVC